MKSSLHKGSFLFSTNLISLCPLTKVHGIFSNRSYSSGGKKCCDKSLCYFQEGLQNTPACGLSLTPLSVKYPKLRRVLPSFNRFRILKDQHLLDMNNRFMVGTLKILLVFKGLYHTTVSYSCWN